MDSLTNPVLVKTLDGFDIYFQALIEDEEVDDDDDGQTAEAIGRGEYVLFCAEVWAEKCGTKLGESEYLGQCIYDSYEAFYESEGDYFGDMAAAAVESAKAKLKELCS